MKTQKFWLFLVGALLLVSAAASILIFRGRAEASAARIYQDGECIRTIELVRVDAPFSFTVEWEGGYNLIEVERGRIRVAEADCPDQVCVRHGAVQYAGESIVCLPHKLVITIEGGAANDIDGSTG